MPIKFYFLYGYGKHSCFSTQMMLRFEGIAPNFQNDDQKRQAKREERNHLFDTRRSIRPARAWLMTEMLINPAIIRLGANGRNRTDSLIRSRSCR